MKAKPTLSEHFASRKPSAIRMAQIEFMQRQKRNPHEKVQVINTAIGNVSLPMHKAMRERLKHMGHPGEPFADGVVKYSPTVGIESACKTMLHIIACSGFPTEGLYAQITDGGSAAMELVILGVAGAAGTSDRPVLLIDPAYTNYRSMAQRIGRRVVSVRRLLQDDGRYSLPDWQEIEEVILQEKVSSIVVIPYDNPTGQFFSKSALIKLSEIAVKHNLWVISDEAYRELFYDTSKERVSSIWGISDHDVPGIEGRRISIESTSKVWNACGLRIGAIVTDNQEFHQKSVAEYTANLCANLVGQQLFSAILEESKGELHRWYNEQRSYYQSMMSRLAGKIKETSPGVIVSSPDAALYSVIDVRKIAPKNFNAEDFVMFCASKGVVTLQGQQFTLLMAPMAEFYQVASGRVEDNPGRTQMRIAYVETPEKMELVPELFSILLKDYLNC
ncbi:MAG: aminotransferase class I/II-fold pyridoxal phosphate-dependent enzyme [Oligoflexia bacterium]|nr:aminotransferase class I/II-fold pyridoxal phosphate-dependent enzyme [Oligoflexia bacterium]MBF0365270.1 aminotransferase class I/II-fold pyridoxal phosphate-dependent enzyme [Oligoflexia bacterium]